MEEAPWWSLDERPSALPPSHALFRNEIILGRQIVKFKHGSKPPSTFLTPQVKKQMVWYEPPGEEPSLYWCNERGEWFEVLFSPTPYPFPLPEGEST